MSAVSQENLDDAEYTLRAIRAVSDLLCNMGLQPDMNVVRPENLNALITILADRLEQALQR